MKCVVWYVQELEDILENRQRDYKKSEKLNKQKENQLISKIKVSEYIYTCQMCT